MYIMLKLILDYSIIFIIVLVSFLILFCVFYHQIYDHCVQCINVRYLDEGYSLGICSGCIRFVKQLLSPFTSHCSQRALFYAVQYYTNTIQVGQYVINCIIYNRGWVRFQTRRGCITLQIWWWCLQLAVSRLLTTYFSKLTLVR